MEQGSELISTRVYHAAQTEALPAAWEALRNGQVVVFPTDTVYGVGCDLWQPEAIERLYWAKLRPKRMAIPVLVSAPEHVAQVARELPTTFALLAERFWPGALTLVVPRHPRVPDALCEGGPTVAVRMPDHPLALRLIEGMGGALAVTSANLSGQPPATNAAQALAQLAGRVAVILDGGECPGGVPSSIIDLVADPPRLLRQGHLSYELLREVLPTLQLSTSQPEGDR